MDGGQKNAFTANTKMGGKSRNPPLVLLFLFDDGGRSVEVRERDLNRLQKLLDHLLAGGAGVGDRWRLDIRYITIKHALPLHLILIHPF